MARKIAITNQKGGVGKTTTTLGLAAAFHLKGKKVLLVDLDTQGNASAALGLILEQDATTLKELLSQDANISEYIVSTEFMDIIPANNSLKDIEQQLSQNDTFDLLKKRIAPIEADYDFILFDCPPSFNVFTINGLVAADEYIIPVDVGYFAILGLKQLLEEINQIKQKLNPSLSLSGVLASKHDKRTTLSNQVLETLKSNFQDTFFKTTIRVNIDLVRAQIANESIFKFNPKSTGAQDFLCLSEEIIND
jgi:chromosome partitioning protein